MKVYCNNCKKILDESFKFCKYCGSSDIITEYPEAPKPKPQFEIEGDILRKYNHNLEYIKYEESFSHEIAVELAYLSGDRSFSPGFSNPNDYALKGIEHFLKNGVSDEKLLERINRWKKETSIVIPSSVKTIRGYDCDCAIKPVFDCNIPFYNISIPNTVTGIKANTFKNIIIGFLNIPSSISKYEQNGVCVIPMGLENTFIHELKIEEGPVEFSFDHFNSSTIHKLILPKSLRRMKVIENSNYYDNGFCTCARHVGEMTIPGDVVELDPNLFLFLNPNQIFRANKFKYEGTKTRFKSICKISSFPKYFEREREWKYDCIIHCSDGDLRFIIRHKNDRISWKPENLEIVFK